MAAEKLDSAAHALGDLRERVFDRTLEGVEVEDSRKKMNCTERDEIDARVWLEMADPLVSGQQACVR